MLASPAIFDGLTALFTSLAGTMENREGLTAIRLLVTSLALLLPATMMGATFPAIIAGAALLGGLLLFGKGRGDIGQRKPHRIIRKRVKAGRCVPA